MNDKARIQVQITHVLHSGLRTAVCCGVVAAAAHKTQTEVNVS